MDATLNRYQPTVLSIFRIVFGLLILQHGCQKWFGFPMPGPQNVTLMSQVGWAGLIELVGGALITLGLFTRAAAFIVCGEMAAAYFLAHFPMRGLTPMGNGGITVVAYCFACLLLVFYGGGPWSLDAILRKKT